MKGNDMALILEEAGDLCRVRSTPRPNVPSAVEYCGEWQLNDGHQKPLVDRFNVLRLRPGVDGHRVMGSILRQLRVTP